MKRKEIAQETLGIQQQGAYEWNGTNIDFATRQRASEEGSFLLTPEQGRQLVAEMRPPGEGAMPDYRVVNQSTVQAIVEMAREGHTPAVLNFASAKNPGGGFLNGAMAQEEALAASGGLYSTLLLHEAYYTANRGCGTMMYTDHAIYSPEVVFFRDGQFDLLEHPVTASVLTLPAVNMGQVLLKGEDTNRAKQVMKGRMRLCLAIFAKQKDTQLILGAYGCGVFRNSPDEVAGWWKELLEVEGYGRFFREIVFAVMTQSDKHIKPFEERFRSGE